MAKKNITGQKLGAAWCGTEKHLGKLLPVILEGRPHANRAHDSSRTSWKTSGWWYVFDESSCFGKATKDMDSRLEEIAIAADDTVPKPSSGVATNALDQTMRGYLSCKIRLWHCLPIRDFFSDGLMEVTLKRREERIGQSIEANK